MSHTVPFRLNKPATVFQAGEYTGFGIRTGVRYQDPKTKELKYTNYQAVIFARSQAQIDFYTWSLVEGAMAVVSAQQQYIESFDGKNGQVLTIVLINANIEAVSGGSGQSQKPQQQKQAAPQQPPAAFVDFGDDSIPF